VNRIHDMLCSSRWWARRAEHELVPWGLKGVELGNNVLEIGPGSGTTTRVLWFTVLHHIPTVAQQDQAFGEVARVLRSGGTFAGTDSVGRGWLFRAIHVGDTLNLIDPNDLPRRLERAGLEVREVRRAGRSFRWRASRP
jgi:hypothetical protein